MNTSNKRERAAQLRASIMVTMLKSNLNVDAVAQQDENGEWYLQVKNPVPLDYNLSDEVAGIKIVRV